MTDPSDPNGPRLDAIVEVLVEYARRDFSRRCPVGDALDEIDAIATGLNMMAEELEGSVASRTDLLQAHGALREAQGKLLHAGRLAAIGQLASGVAHEVNNPAGWALLSLASARQTVARFRAVGAEEPVPPEQVARAADELDDVLGRAVDGLERIRAVVVDLLLFARASEDDEELVLLDEVTETGCKLVEPSLREHATVTFTRGHVPAVRASRARLGQVVTNLVANAGHALRDAGRNGHIDVRTASDADAVLLVVDDTGPGVPDELRERIFDPFFTTSTTGTGLGLSLVAEIVTRYGGTICVDDAPIGGARFVVRFPAAVA